MKSKIEFKIHRDVAIFLVLLLLGVACAAWLDVPNAKPIAAIGLFGGVVFGRMGFALACPVLVLWLTVAGQAVADWPIQVAITAGLLFGVFVGRALRPRILKRTISGSTLFGLVASSLVCSLAFYFVSNWAWWQFADFYPSTFAGLGSCLLAGLPFLANTVLGDLCFNALLFGVAALWVSSPSKSAIWIAFKAAPLRN